MIEMKLTLKPLSFASRTFKTIPQHQKIAAKISTIHSPSQSYLAKLTVPDSLASMSLSSLLYFALIGDNATAS